MFETAYQLLLGELPQLLTYQFYAALMGIILVDLLLSGDNALVIAAVTAKLPPGKQRAGVVIGSSLAIGLRVILAFGAAWALSWPGVALLGGLYLIKVGYDLVKPEGAGEEHGAANSLWAAVVTIGLVDVSMSYDNVVAIASMANGSMMLMALGVALSIPMVIGFSLVISRILETFPITKWIGAIFLAALAGKVMAHDASMTWMFGRDDDGAMMWTLIFTSVAVLIALAQFARQMHVAEGSDDRQLLTGPML
jgi:YjbE family integral membrane protein